jgi:cell division protein FtsW (lipid II flippase)
VTTDRRRQSDPLRPLHLAIRSTRLLGFCSAVFGFVFVFAFGYLNRYKLYRLHFIAIGLIVWLIPGVLLMTYSFMMTQRRRRAAIGAFFMALVQGLFAIAALVGSCTLSPVSPIPILLSALWVIAIAQLLAHLKQSLPLLEHDVERRPGFEVRFNSDERQDARTP